MNIISGASTTLFLTSQVSAQCNLAEIDQIQRFEEQAKSAKYAGLYWKRKQSGNRESERTSLTYTGNHYLRYYLVEAANAINTAPCTPGIVTRNTMKFQSININKLPYWQQENLDG